MECLVIGYRYRNDGFKNGVPRDEFIVFCTRDANPYDNEQGQGVEIITIPGSMAKVKPINIGDVINPSYNRIGQLQSY